MCHALACPVQLVELERAHGAEKEALLRQQLEMQSKCADVERQLKDQSEEHNRRLHMREQVPPLARLQGAHARSTQAGGAAA